MRFQISGLPVAPFAPLFGLSDAELMRSLGALLRGLIGRKEGGAYGFL
jgi:hypothetical protein